MLRRVAIRALCTAGRAGDSLIHLERRRDAFLAGRPLRCSDARGHSGALILGLLIAGGRKRATPTDVTGASRAPGLHPRDLRPVWQRCDAEFQRGYSRPVRQQKRARPVVSAQGQ